MNIEHKGSRLSTSKTMEQYEEMLKMIKQFPVKENNIRVVSSAGKWKLNANMTRLKCQQDES